MARTITVIGSYGEVVQSDRIVFSISCTSSKTTAEEARQSVAKRQEYIAQSCKNDGAKELKENSLLTKTADMFTFIKETQMMLNSVEKLDLLRNRFVEKLDSSVRIHEATFGFREKTLADVSKRAFSNACTIAREKASHLCSNLDVVLGECLKIEEVSSEWMITSTAANNSTEREYRSTVSAQFIIQ